jgi:hypothetical protein
MRERRHGGHAIIKKGRLLQYFLVIWPHTIPSQTRLSHLARRSRSATKSQRQQQGTGQRSSMHTACPLSLFFLAIAVLRFWFLKFRPPYTFPADCPLPSWSPRDVYGDTGGFFSMPPCLTEPRAVLGLLLATAKAQGYTSLLLGVASGIADAWSALRYDRSRVIWLAGRWLSTGLWILFWCVWRHTMHVCT